MSLVIAAIFAVLLLLIVAGPVLEDLIDRVWPPDRTRSRAPAKHSRDR